MRLSAALALALFASIITGCDGPTLVSSSPQTVEPSPEAAQSFGPIAASSEGQLVSIPNWQSDNHFASINDPEYRISSVSNPELFDVQPHISASGALEFQTKYLAQGESTLEVVATSSADPGLSQTASIVLRITKPDTNNAPSFTGGQDIHSVTDGANKNFDDWAKGASDNDNDTQALSFHVVDNSNPQLFEIAPWVSYPSQTLRFRAVRGAAGTAQIGLQLRDNGGDEYGGVDQSEIYYFNIHLTAPVLNNAPSFTIGDDVRVPVNAGIVALSDWACCAKDNDGDTQRLHFAIVENTAPQLFSAPPSLSYPSHTLRFATANDAVGVAHLKVRLIDDGGSAHGGQDSSTTQSFSIEIYRPQPNNAPSFEPGPDVTVPNDTGEVAIPAWAENVTDNDGNTQHMYYEILENSNPSILIAQPHISYPSGTLRFSTNPLTHGYTDIKARLIDDGGTAYGGENTSKIKQFRISTTADKNHAPIANSMGKETQLNTTISFDLIASDADGDSLQFTILANPTNGRITQQGASIVYTPSLNFVGRDQFQFEAHDGIASSNTATVSITVIAPTAVNSAPVADSASYQTNEDTSITFELSGADADGDPLVYEVMSKPSLGKIQQTGNQVIYSPESNNSGHDELTFRISDGALYSNIATIDIEVLPVNDSPLVRDEQYAIDKNTSLTDTLFSDDPDGDSLSLRIVTEPRHGSYTLTGDQLSYTPDADFVGIDTIAYVANDGTKDSEVATIVITVIDHNTAPVVSDQTIELDENTSVTFTLSADDAEGDLLTFSIQTPAMHGTITPSGSNFTYTPNTNFYGADSFTYTANDGSLDSNLGTVNFTINSVNNAPEFVTTAQTHATVLSPYTYDFDATDPDGDVISFTLINAPAGMTIDTTNQQLSWTPTPAQAGSADVELLAQDIHGLSDTQAFTIDVSTTNVAPVITSSPITTGTVGSLYNYSVTATDPDNDTLTFALVDAPPNMQIDQSSGLLSWTPESDLAKPISNHENPYCYASDISSTSSKPTVDFSVVIDHSGSMSGEHEWVSDLIPALEAGYLNQNIGIKDANGYGLVSYEAQPSPFLVGGADFGTYQEFLVAADSLRTFGGIEDGYNAVNHVLTQYQHRTHSAKRILLVTDEPRDVVDSSVTYDTLLQSLLDSETTLNSVLAVGVNCGDGTSALGLKGDGTGIVSDGFGGFDFCQNAEFTSPSDRSVTEYAELTFDSGGTVWDLSKLRSGGINAVSFSRALVDLEVSDVLANLPAEAREDLGIEQISHSGLTLAVQVKNYGQARSGNTALSLMDASGIEVAQFTVPALSSGDTHTVDFAITALTDFDGEIALTLGGSSTDCVPGNNSVRLPIITIQVEDPQGASAQQSYLLVSNTSNQAPVFSSTAITEAAIATSYIYNATVDDQVGDDHIFNLVDAPDGMIINPYSGIVQFKATASQAGTETVTIEATDLSGATAQQSFDLAISTSNTTTAAGPKFSPALGTINFVASTTQYYSPTVVADASLSLSYSLIVGPDECAVDRSSGEMSCNFGANLPDQTWTYVGVEDQFGRSDLLNVRTNRPPSFITSTLADTSYNRAYSQALHASDPDGDTITYSIVTGPDDLIVSGSALQWTAPERYADTTQAVTLRVSDEFGAYEDKDFSITVHRNRAPVINNAPADVYNIGRNYSYSISASDADKDTLQYAFTSIPTGATVSNNRITWEQSALDQPEVTIAFSVSDGFGGQADLSVNIPIFDNRAPVWSSESAVTIAEGHSLDYRPKATDPDHDRVTYSLVSGPAGAELQSGYRIIWSPTLAQLGVHQMVLKAADAYGGETEFTLNVTVGQNTPPRITTVPVQAVISGHDYFSLNRAEDDDGDGISFSLETAPEGMTVNSYNGGYIRWTPTLAQVGTHDVVLVATDTYGGKSFLSFQVVVSTNQPPTIDFVPTTETISGHSHAEHLLASDPDGDSVRFELVSAPDGMTAYTHNGGYMRWTATDAQVGTHPVSLRAYDTYGGEVFLNYDITVKQNASPVFVSPVTQWDLVVGTYSTLTFATSDSDADYVYLREAAAPISANAENFSVRGHTARWTPATGQEGTYEIVLQAYDNYGGITNHTIQATVHGQLYFTTVPEGTVFESGVSSYTSVVASHPDNLRRSYSLLQAPAGVTITPSNGYIYWTPADTDIGVHTIKVEANTSDGLSATATFDIEVIATNQAPVIDAIPDQNLLAETPWSYQVSASDPEGSELSYSFNTRPSGMSIDSATGLMHYTPTRGQLGGRTVTVRASDTRGKNTELSFAINVAERANTPPAISSTPDTGAVVDQLYSYANLATDAEDDALTYSLISGPDGATISDNTISWLPTDTQVGANAFSLSVDDSFGPVEQNFSVEVLATNGAPVVEIISPLDADRLTESLSITGSVTDPHLKRWQVLTRAVSSDEDDWLTLAEGTTEKNSEHLADIDPSLLMNGQQIIRLLAEDNYGASTATDVTVTLEGDLKVGNFSFTLEDLRIPMAGIPIQVTRTYDSRRRSEDLDFGYGWTIDYQNAKVESSRTLGEGWSLNSYTTGPLGALKNYCVEPNGAPVVTVTLPTGDVERFEVAASPRCNTVYPIVDVQLAFNATGDTDATLEALDDRYARLMGGSTLAETGTFSDPVDPTRFMLTTRSGYKYLLDKDFGIEYVDDPNGNTLFYTDNGIIHSSGKAVRFQRDNEDRIVRVIDPDGQEIKYSYDTSGDLTTATDRDGGDSTYSYNSNHGLVEMYDALGRKLLKNIYDTDGRLIAQEDENGDRTEYNHDIAGKLSTITDRLGNQTILYYDERGNVTTTVDALGNTSTATFDANDNQTSITDALGNTQTATYNASNDQLTQTDALGNTTTYEYNTRGQDTKITDPTGDVFETTYDSVGNLLSVTDPDGNVAGNNINAQGLPSSAVDALGNTTTYSYDAEGNKTQETDPTGAVMDFTYDSNNVLTSQTRHRTVNGTQVAETTTYTLDALGRTTSTLDALGHSSQVAYDLAGHEVSHTDELGNTTSTEYDVYGNVTQMTYPDGSVSTRSYDAEHNLISETDANGNTTTHGYDALNREISTTTADGSTTHNTFDAAGRLTSSTDALGNTTQYEYDAAGRRTATVDALGNRFESTYSADGNLLTETDALGNVTQHSYNALDQRISTTFADNQSIDDSFDATGRRTQHEDQAGLQTQYDYDENGRLIKVTDALGGETTYTYDEAGNKLTQSDALGRTTRWTYDALGRVLTRTLPLGQTETSSYDAAGNLSTHTDFNGQLSSYSYDSRNRLASVTYADGRTESFSYDAVGNTTQALYTPASGTTHTVDYSYDALNRLIRETRSDGDTLAYQYDANGNRTQVDVTLRNGDTQSTQYSFDALNRLSQVTDNSGGVTTYRFDANGNRSSVEHANGTTQSYRYDSVNRLTDTETQNAAGTTLQSFAYTLDTTGRRTAITEGSGRSTTYSYDSLYRLTGESITGVVPYSATYTYDAVGNRTFETVDGISTAYTLDDNDRLLTQGGVTYSYDAQGNTLSQDDNGTVTTYGYDAKNKVTSSTANGLTTSYQYNHNGTRTAKEQNGVSTHFVFDENRDYSQVLVELNGNTTEVSYTYGDDLLSQTRAGVSSTYHYDGLGSTRALSDASGLLSDSYDYDAFGIELQSTGSSDNDYRYTGEQYDAETDQYHLRARQYAPTNGRFTQMDSWMGNNADPVTLHKYAYGNLDPANTVDPTGQFGMMSLGIASNIRSTLSNIQIEVGLSILDSAFSASNADSASNSGGGDLLMGVAALGGQGAFKLLRMLSSKFRKACNSFDGETLVATEHGPKAIKDIEIGDKVWAYNEETGKQTLQPVIHLIQGEGSKELVDIELLSGEVITATANHPFYAANDQSWLEAGELSVDDLLLKLDTTTTGIEQLTPYNENTTVYNLTVANDHTYFVGDDGVLAHNSGFCAPLNFSSKATEHLFKGNKNGGFHSAPGGRSRSAARIVKVLDKVKSGRWNGAYRAKVRICPPGGQCFYKESTMFPDSWRKSRVQKEIHGAYLDALTSGRRSGAYLVGRSPSGGYIKMIVKPDGDLVTAFPDI